MPVFVAPVNFKSRSMLFVTQSLESQSLRQTCQMLVSKTTKQQWFPGLIALEKYFPMYNKSRKTRRESFYFSIETALKRSWAFLSSSIKAMLRRRVKDTNQGEDLGFILMLSWGCPVTCQRLGLFSFLPYNLTGFWSTWPRRRQHPEKFCCVTT